MVPLGPPVGATAYRILYNDSRSLGARGLMHPWVFCAGAFSGWRLRTHGYIYSRFCSPHPGIPHESACYLVLGFFCGGAVSGWRRRTSGFESFRCEHHVHDEERGRVVYATRMVSHVGRLQHLAVNVLQAEEFERDPELEVVPQYNHQYQPRLISCPLIYVHVIMFNILPRRNTLYISFAAVAPYRTAHLAP